MTENINKGEKNHFYHLMTSISGTSDMMNLAAESPETTAQDDCPTRAQFFLLFEVGVSNLPILIFLVTSYVNYRQV